MENSPLQRHTECLPSFSSSLAQPHIPLPYEALFGITEGNAVEADEISRSYGETSCSSGLFPFGVAPSSEVNFGNAPTHASGELSSNTEKLDSQILWWRNAPFLYSGVLSHKLEWPTLTVEFLNSPAGSRSKQSIANTSGWLTQKLLLGTCTSGQETDSLLIGELKFPVTFFFKEDPLKCENYSGFIAPRSRNKLGCSPAPQIPHFEIKARLIHSGDVNRAVHMPQNEFLIATQSSSGKAFFFDYSKHPSYPTDTTISTPQLILRGHTKEGFGLSWHPGEKGLLASASTDGTLAVWNVSAGGIKYKTSKVQFGPKAWSTATTGYLPGINEESVSIDPLYLWSGDTLQSAQNDVHFHPLHSFLLSSCSDDGRFSVWDLRQNCKPQNPAACGIQSNESAINSLAHNWHCEYVLATGNDIGSIALWDLRSLKMPTHNMRYHSDSINRLHFNPGCSALLGSASQDSTVVIWDLSRCQVDSENISNSHLDKAVSENANSPTGHDKLNEVPKEVLFVHGGHRGGVSDFCWSLNRKQPLLAASAGWDNRLCCWQMAETAFADV
ncbi:WD domain, G-beta repeat-containing protein [Cardiosporidium cionae]|uniref:WD domain, G-beta repeat-containing protein n=1 Tax=Cardiosporidium cionae TaxID=476202 RepID=A0ABQ7J959_9APIC|nr:WD domain, G-beta repeat-containing protein [Cardiosporidium cionae]|eukprot:KAF8820526.1 WD domain, G-beta repeat-containing protein [Cardiosporidium cionae]